MQIPDLKGVREAYENLRDVSIVTPLTLNERLSEKLDSRIFFKVNFRLRTITLTCT